MSKSPRPEVHAELSRDLNLFHVTSMGLGMMIGAGVFIGIGMCMGQVGPGGLMMTFVLNGLIALFSAMSFAELASAIPRAGGTYNFARIGFGRPASFLAGWTEWLAAAAAGAFYAIVLATYTQDFLSQMFDWVPAVPSDHTPWTVRGIALAAAGAFIYINFRGSKETGKLGAIFTVAQMIFVIGIGVVGVVKFFIEPSRIENFQPFLGDGNWWSLLGTMGIIYVAFEGFEVIAQAGDETIDPKRTIPKAILYSVCIVTLTYVLVAFGTIVGISHNNPELAGVPVWQWIGDEGALGFGRAVSQIIPGGIGGILVTLAVLFSATSALNATIYSATRSSYALGRDRMLPASFGKIHPKTKTPYIALSATAIIMLLLVLVLDPKAGSATASMMFLLLFLLVNLCVIRIRRQMGDELQYGFLMPLFPLFPILAILLQTGMAGGIFHESTTALVITLVWVPLGAMVYYFYARHRTIATEDEIHVLDERVASPGDDDGKYRVMVAVANPENALQMVQTTFRICEAKEAAVELIHMVPVPSQVPLSDSDRFSFGGREAILETMMYLAPQYPLNTTLRYCRSAARGIVSAIREKRVDMLIMGWHGRSKQNHFTIGSTVDPITERASCDVLMLKNCGGNRKYERVLVPIAGGPNSALALETASMLADREGGRVTVFTVHREGSEFSLEEYVQEHADSLHLPIDRIDCVTAPAGDVVETILAAADEHDLLVLGSTAETRLQKMHHLPIPETIAHRHEGALIMCRANKGLQSWLRRWF